MWTLNGWQCSASDCGAPYNEKEIYDDDGEVIDVVCGCSRCERLRKRQYEED